MGKKRKSTVGSSQLLDEVDRTMYSTFCSAANSLSQLYTHSMNQQKLSFHAGERYSLEKLYQWILGQQEGGSRVNTFDILNYLQNELTYGGEDPSMLSRQQQANTGSIVPSGPSSALNPGQGFRTEQQEAQPRNHIFSNALSSPIRRSLQNYHIAQGNHYTHGSQHSNDSSMDMNAESSGHEPTR